MEAFFGRFFISLVLAAIITVGCWERLRRENFPSRAGKKSTGPIP